MLVQESTQVKKPHPILFLLRILSSMIIAQLYTVHNQIPQNCGLGPGNQSEFRPKRPAIAEWVILATEANR